MILLPYKLLIRVKNNDFEVILKVAKSIIILTTILIKNNDILFRGRNKRKVLRLPRKEPKNKNLFLENTLHSILTDIKRSKSNMKLIKKTKST